MMKYDDMMCAVTQERLCNYTNDDMRQMTGTEACRYYSGLARK